MSNAIDIAELNAMDLGELRAYAKQFFNIVVLKGVTKEQLIQEIVKRAEGGGLQRARPGAADGPKPGWARVIIAKDAHKIGGVYPVFSSVNTHTLVIPRGVVVDIPIKHYNMLVNDCTQVEYTQDDSKAFDEPGKEIVSEVSRFNIRVLAMNEGPDPRPTWESQRMRKLEPFYRFVRQHGFYPSVKVMKDYIQAGSFKLVEPSQAA